MSKEKIDIVKALHDDFAFIEDFKQLSTADFTDAEIELAAYCRQIYCRSLIDQLPISSFNTLPEKQQKAWLSVVISIIAGVKNPDIIAGQLVENCTKSVFPPVESNEENQFIAKLTGSDIDKLKS